MPRLTKESESALKLEGQGSERGVGSVAREQCE